ncbi:MAG: ABC transporter ATP-binding protein [Chloroflexi bacterium]|nr:ABC transporter ATP-binding protein [Chloroflexota bacterium]
MLSNGASPYAVQLGDVSKRYLLDPQRPWRLKDVIARPKSLISQLTAKEPFWALRDISLNVKHGEILGIIGHNGSGKSTLLRILAGISPPTLGTVEINGRYGALLELGAGFHPNASGRENAYVNALFMGMSKDEAKAALPSIIEFSELGPFIDQPMRTYSSGMYLRLGFSVAIHVKPDILLVDEVLAVGDADFQEKCFEHFRTLRARNTTIIIVTHNVDTLIDFADRAISLEKGRIKREGAPIEVVQDYMNALRRESPAMERAFQRALAGHLAQEAMKAGVVSAEMLGIAGSERPDG